MRKRRRIIGGLITETVARESSPPISRLLGKVPVTGQQRVRGEHRSCTSAGLAFKCALTPRRFQDRHAVLSERAVLIRVHRVNAATSERSAGTKTNCPNEGVEQERRTRRKKTVGT